MEPASPFRTAAPAAEPPRRRSLALTIAMLATAATILCGTIDVVRIDAMGRDTVRPFRIVALLEIALAVGAIAAARRVTHRAFLPTLCVVLGGLSILVALGILALSTLVGISFGGG